MNMEAKLFALKGYIDREISILKSKVDKFVESLKETITKIQKELLAKNDLIKSLMET